MTLPHISRVYVDDEALPENRSGELCRNCNEYYFQHYGWACSEIDQGKLRSEIPVDAQYYTKDMPIDRPGFKRNQISPDLTPISISVVDVKHESDHWKAWRHNEPGDCFCGIKRNLCDYHK
jgi:hypothetical protein